MSSTFFDNVLEVKRKVENDSSLVDRIKEIIDHDLWMKKSNFGSYTPLTEEIGIKKKQHIQGPQEVAIMVDVYDPIRVSPDFVVLIKEDKLPYDGVTYLVTNFPNLRDIDYIEKLSEENQTVLGEFWIHMVQKGYQIHHEELRRCMGISDGKLVAFDLDASTFENIMWEPINAGLISGKPPFNHLKVFYETLKSDKYRLNI